MQNHNETEAEILQTILDNDLGLDDEEIVMLIKDSLSKRAKKEKEDYTFGAKAADKIAKFAGSWTFIIIFIFCLVTWMIINTKLKNKAFDPYPFILLNLVLSCVAAIQAPLIMMSQNRQEEKDRQRAQEDYIVNLKTEIIIRDIHKHLEQIEKKLYDQKNLD